MSGALRAAVFDLDDTLVLERDFVRSGFTAVAEAVAPEAGAAPAAVLDELLSLLDNGARGDTFDRWCRARGLPIEPLVGDMVEVYRGHGPMLTPIPGIPELLRTLSTRIPLGLVSDGYLSVQERKLEASGLGPFFRATVFGDALGREHWKPSVKPFETVLEDLGVPAHAAVYVGDNCAKDFIGPRVLGMCTIWVRYSDGHYARHTPPSPDHEASHTVDSVDELGSLLMSMLP